jgi:phosphoribosyl 1,2-cyclic phosphodiesterase
VRFASLGSGSEGNALLIEVHSTRVLLDCGFGVADTTRRLARLGVQAEDVSGILVTHEHEDHIGGVARFARKHGLPVWLTGGTYRGLEQVFQPDVSVTIIQGYEAFSVGDIHVAPYPVPHDAREPAQYVFSDGVRRLGVLTDAGHITPHMQRCLNGCNALVMECNHEPDMLESSTYPPSLKSRIASRFGHLDNASAARLLGLIDRTRLQHVIAAHLSQNNNRPELAQQALAQVLGCAREWITVADQQRGFGWRQIL